MFTADIGGREELRKVQGLLAGSDKVLQAELAKNTRTAIAPIKREIPAEALKRMPSGYGPTLARSTKVTTRVTAGTTVKAVVKVKATGKRDDRDIKSLDRGLLRHPLFGNRKHWYPPPGPLVRRGFVSDPVEATRKRIVQGAKKAADKVADTIVKG